MKFKYNLLERRLYKLQAEYTHEVSEDNYFRYPSGIGREGFLLGENERIIFTFAYPKIKVYYQKGEIAYQKTLKLPQSGESIFEFAETDRINSS